MAVLVSKSLEQYETTDVTKANFFALMFFVVALGNLCIFAAVGWLSNVVAQVCPLFSLAHDSTSY